MVPGIQELADEIGVQNGYWADTDKSPHDLVVYRLDDAYYLDAQLRFVPVVSSMFEHCDMFGNSDALFYVGYRSDEEIAAVPAERYMVKLSPDNVADLLQRKVAPPSEDAPALIAAADFDFARAERCPANPVKFKKYNSPIKEYGKAQDYYPYGYPIRHTFWYTVSRPLAWASWGVEIPMFVATNAVYYAVVVPFDTIVEGLLGG